MWPSMKWPGLQLPLVVKHQAQRNLALTRSYDPFGVVLQETGSGEALFGFMGAQAGGMGLLYVGGRQGAALVYLV